MRTIRLQTEDDKRLRQQEQERFQRMVLSPNGTQWNLYALAADGSAVFLYGPHWLSSEYNKRPRDEWPAEIRALEIPPPFTIADK